MQLPDPKKPQKSRPPVPETVGATSEPFKIGKSPSTVQLEVHPPTGPGLLRADGQPKRILLRVENMTSLSLAPSISVYLNVPPGETAEKRPDLYAMKISTFGLFEASQPKGDHPGDGLSFTQDISELYAHLTASKDWDGKKLRLTFIPGRSGDSPVDISIGRVSLQIE